MNHLIIYDNTGYVLSNLWGITTPREPVGIPFLWLEIPEKKRLVSVDVSVTPNVPVYEDIPKTEIEVMQEAIDFLLMGGM